MDVYPSNFMTRRPPCQNVAAAPGPLSKSVKKVKPPGPSGPPVKTDPGGQNSAPSRAHTPPPYAVL
jgi:hypothetical protein